MRVAYKVVLSLIVLVVALYVVYIVLNWEALIKIFTHERGAKTPQDIRVQEIVDLARSPAATAPPVIQLPASPPTAALTSDQRDVRAEIAQTLKNDWLYYPKLGIQAPVEWYVLGPANANKMMADGLVHVSGTATPEQGGDAVITGHSSYLRWAKGDYKTIFAPLVKAEKDDDIIIKRDGRAYFYAVKDIFEISGSAGYKAIVDENSPKTVSLMTCVPVGTNLRRLIVKGELFREI